MAVTRRADYAIRMMVELARQESGQPVPAREIGARQEVPPEFARSIATELATAGLIRAKRGAHGGLTLARRAADISVYEILLAIDGGVSISTCTVDPDWCPRTTFCEMHKIWRGADRYLEEYLTSVRLNALAASFDEAESKSRDVLAG